MDVMVFTFEPVPAGTVPASFNATTANTAVAINNTAVGNVSRQRSVRIYNAGPNLAFVTFGSSTVTTSVGNGMPIPVGIVEVIGIASATHVAGATQSDSATVYFTKGMGA